MNRQKTKNENSSFRDPSGFVFYHKDVVYRQLNKLYAADYSLLMESGLYDHLVKDGLLVSHTEAPRRLSPDGESFKIIRPETIPFISYPYEWSFSQLRQAALLTLKIQKISLQHGMSLKDGSAFNVQFIGSKEIFIDSASFEKYKPGVPWVAYRQFCQHFLAPLALMSYTDLRLGQLLRPYLDGIPLDLAARLLPFSARVNLGLNVHLFLHSKSQVALKDKKAGKKTRTKLSLAGLTRIIDHLSETITNLKSKDMNTPWEAYYSFTNYSPISFQKKKQLVSQLVDSVHPKIVWDLGANTGEFSKLPAQAGAYTVSFDSDIRAIEKLYNSLAEKNDRLILPLVMDLSNPSSNSGWGGEERASLGKRGNADILMALALIHHLCFTNNLPFSRVASYFSGLGEYLLIEFVPKHDSQVIEMLSTRQDIFPWYTEEFFVSEFSQYFNVVRRESIPGTARVLFLMKKKNAHK